MKYDSLKVKELHHILKCAAPKGKKRSHIWVKIEQENKDYIHDPG